MRLIEVLDLVIKPDEFRVFRDNQVLNLPKLSFELFIYLIENADHICTLEQISAGVWKNTVVSNETIIQRITLLRKALGDDPKDPKYVESIRGRGYRLKAIPVHSVANDKLPKHKGLTLAAVLSVSLLIGYMTVNSRNADEEGIAQLLVSRKNSNDTLNKLVERGEYYLSVGQKVNIHSAITLFNQALEIDSSNVDALIGKSYALSRLVCRYGSSPANAREANQLAQKAVSISVENTSAYGALAYSWDCLGNIEKALEYHRTALKMSPGNYRSKSSAAHLYEVQGKLLEAYQLNLSAKQVQPDNPLIDLQIARIFELLRLNVRAESEYQKLFILYPDNVFINQALPRFLFYQSRFSDAKAIYEKVVTRGVNRNDTLLNYAELIWLLDGKKSAIPWFKRAAESNPNYSLANTILQVVESKISKTHATHRISELEKSVSAGNTWPHNYLEATVLAIWILHDTKLAIELLQKGVDLGYLNSEYLTISPLFESLRIEPAFYQLIDNINDRKEQMKKAFLAQYTLKPIDSDN